MRFTLFIFSLLFLSLGKGMAADVSKERGQDKTITVDIASDLEPPATAEEVVPTHPFFAESTANALMGKIQALEERIQKLEKNQAALEKRK